jgi:para-nitrobenzyl esterase
MHFPSTFSGRSHWQAIFALASGLLMAQVCAPSAQAAQADPALISIDTGLLRGSATAANKIFLGIPYAKPPLNELRWTAPQAPAPWQGERDATRMALPCSQPLSAVSHEIKQHQEDCLYLNVYTPPDAQPGAALPVIVWIHGGAATTGSASEYPAAGLAQTGRAVVVTINYRLGVFGFLALPELQKQDPKMNFGMQDQLAALQWVQRNIAAFGGDKQRVTIAGESFGGQSVMIHMVSKLSAGLMHRAIVQSAAPTGLFNAPWTIPVAFATSETYVSGTSCAQSTDRMTCLRKLPAQDLLDASPYSTDFRKPSGIWGPMLDGQLFPAPVFDKFKSGDFNRVPLLIGMNRDELQALVALAYQVPTGKPPTVEEFKTSLSSFGTPQAASNLLTSFYPVRRYGSPQNALSALLTDFLFMCPNHRATKVLATKVPTFAYRFDDRDAPSILDAPDLNMLAYHGAEVPYLFEMWTDKPLTATQQALAAQMKKYWGNFAATGDPGRSDVGLDSSLPSWPRFVGLKAPYRSLNKSQSNGKTPPLLLTYNDLPHQHQCSLWDTIESFLPKTTPAKP